MEHDAIKGLMAGIRCFALDMDGTFYLGKKLLPGALGFYHAARESGRRVVFLTNNSSRSCEDYVRKLNQMGCPAAREDIYTSGLAAIRYIAQHHMGKSFYIMGNGALRLEFAAHGIYHAEEEPSGVVVGYDTSLTYEKLCSVCKLVREGLPYIATHPDINCPSEEGPLPDLGSMLALIHASAGRWPDAITGKPHAPIMEGLLEMTGMEKHQLCLCGDRLYTDIAAGVNHGIFSVCVLSGETVREDINASPVQPDLVLQGLGDLVRWL